MKNWLFLICVSVQFSAQITLKVTEIPKDTPKNTTIYVAGNFNGWNPNSTPLIADEKGNLIITLSDGDGTIEYKFTRGSWDTAEGNASGKPIPNRNSTFTSKPQTIESKIISWVKTAEKASTAAKNVRLISDSFLIPELGRTRKIWIYLPPDYETGKKKYPVIYMQDGQNLFDNSTSFSGEWEIDETLNKLFSKGDSGAIVVGIDNGGSHRIDEYSPWKNPNYGGGEGDLHADFLAKTLKPYIDKNYRTLRNAKNTALIGSSMGGLISFYTGLKYPEKFRKLSIFSPSFWFAEADLKSFIQKNSKNLKKTQILFLAGTKESENMTKDIDEVIMLLKKKIPEANLKTQFDPHGKHSESYWAKEFPKAYRWLFR